jgi:hypothetical protein
MSADREVARPKQTASQLITQNMEGKPRVEGGEGRCRCRGGGGGRPLSRLVNGARGEKIRERMMWDANELLTVCGAARGEQGEADRAELARPERIGRLGHELLHDVWLSLAPSWVAGHLYASLH